MQSRPTKQQVGVALDQLTSDVKDHMLEAVRQATSATEPHKTALMKQALTLPNLARAQVTAWIAQYNARNGSGAAAFMQSCLTAAGSNQTVASIDAALAALEASALVLVNHRKNDGWTWDQVVAAINFTADPREDFDYSRLPIPVGYTTVWGEPW